jgi:hypothetical protein
MNCIIRIIKRLFDKAFVDSYDYDKDAVGVSYIGISHMLRNIKQYQPKGE